MTLPTPCPEPNRLKDLLDENLPAVELADLQKHLETCHRCQQVLQRLVADRPSWAEVATHLAQGQPAPDRGLQHLMDEIKADSSGAGTHGETASGDPVSIDFLSPSDQPDHIGRLGPYEILEVIGRGGMGVVLKGHDARLNRFVAIKVLVPELASSATAKKRFHREGQAAAAVSHDHVVAIHAVDEAEGLPYLVMEYVCGRSLEDRIHDAGSLELKEILRIGMQTAAGLAAAHAQGLVHRDIKPANILLENDVERVKITDFGLARAVDDVRITKLGTVTGTPEYMSPEQARGESVDPRTDLFSLGGMLYAMCTGRPPFRAESTLAIIHRVCKETPRPIEQINTEIPDWLTRAIDRLLAKDPNDRFQSAVEVADLLEQYLAYVQDPSKAAEPVALPTPLADTGSRKNATGRRRTWGALAVALLALAGGLGLAEASGITNFTATVIRIVRGDGTLVIEIDDPSVQVLIDGEELVFTGTGPSEIRLRPGPHQLRATKDGEPVETRSVTISRGGRQVVKVSQEKPTLSEKAMVVRRVWAGPGVEFSGRVSPRGRFLTFADWNTANLAVHDFDTGKNRALTDEGTWDEPNQYAEASVWSSDSRQVAYMWENEGTWELHTVGLDGSDRRTVYVQRREDLIFTDLLAWSPDGKHLLVQLKKKDRTHQLALVSIADGELRVLKTLGRHHPGLTSFSPDGRTVLYDRPPTQDTRQRDVFLLSVDEQSEVSLVTHPADDRGALFSADGKWVVFLSDRSGNESVWGIKLADGKPQGTAKLINRDVGPIAPLGLTQDGSYYYGVADANSDIYFANLDPDTGGVSHAPTKAVQRFEGFNQAADWSPDGRHLVYLSRRSTTEMEARSPVLVIRTLAAGEERQLSPSLARYALRPFDTPRWLPDGKSIVLMGMDFQGSRGYYQVDAQTGDVTNLLPDFSGSQPTWSVDGSRMFFFRISDSGYVGSIVMRDLQSGRETELYRERIQGPVFLALSPDGQRLAFTSAAALRVMPATGGEPRVLWEMPPQTLSPFATGLVWTRDGKRLLLGKQKSESSGVVELWQVPLDGSEPQTLGVEMSGIRHLQISPDGQQISFTGKVEGRGSEIWVMENFLSRLAQ